MAAKVSSPGTSKVPYRELPNDQQSCPVCGLGARPDITLAGYRLFLCPGCTLRFAPEAFEVELDYDQVYESLEYQASQVKALKTVDPHALAYHGTYRAFFKHMKPRSGTRLLDVGCGVGLFGHAAYARGWDVTGIDVSDLAITLGREHAPFQLRTATVEQMITNGEKFDVITAFEVLEHITAPVRFLSTVQALLPPKGQVFLTVPNWDCPGIQSATRPDWVPPIHLLFFTQRALQQSGERSGLRNVSTGLIWSDPRPRGLVGSARWLARRLLRRTREPVGLWMHGWAAA
jgi:2-polyprenyl-3-methyl-5-hydroxy-6-metoxy-1,4-benzoquinol methylase